MSYNIDAIKASLTIPQLLRMMGRDCDDNAKMINAPHRDEKTPSCSITDNGRRWHDFGTGDGSDVIDMYKAITGKDTKDAIADVARMCGIDDGPTDIDGSPLSSVPSPPRRAQFVTEIESPEIDLTVLRAMRVNLKHFLDKGKPNAATRALQWIPEEHLIRVLRKGWLGATWDGRLVYLMRRGIKCRNNPDSSRGDRWQEGKAKDNLFVSFKDSDIYKTGCNKLMLCEGESDTIAATIQFDDEYKIAGVLGASQTPPMEMLYPLLRGTEEVVIAFDGDEAGRKAANRIKRFILDKASAMKIKIPNIPDGEDVKSLYLKQLKDKKAS